MARRIWSITLVPDGGAVRTFRVPIAVVFWLAAIVVGNVVTLAGSGLALLSGFKSKQESQRVRQENAQLRTHVVMADASIGRLETLVAQTEALERQTRALAGLDPIDPETRLMGVGGPFAPAMNTSRPVDPKLAASVRTQQQRLDDLIRRSDLQRQSYRETLESLERQEVKLAHTPTISPLRGSYEVSSGFGARPDPFTSEVGVHRGVDLRAPHGTPVYATAGGVVAGAAAEGDFGLSIRINHGYGVETVYCHLSGARVRAGQEVARGAVIGTVGSSGRSTGAHLHYEVHVDGVPRNPAAFILSPTAVVD